MRYLGFAGCLALVTLAAAPVVAEVMRDSDGDVLSVINPRDYIVETRGGGIVYYFRGVEVQVNTSSNPVATQDGVSGGPAKTVQIGGDTYRVQASASGAVHVQDIATGRRYATKARAGAPHNGAGKRINPTAFALD